MPRFKFRYVICFITFLPFACFANTKPLNESIAEIENEISGRVGVSVLDTQNNKTWNYKGSERFPMMSTFKALACAKLLRDAEVKKEIGLLEKAYPIEKDSLIVWSPVTEKLIGGTISLVKSCEATMLTSDNTAANFILDGIGGPEKLTAFLRSISDEVTRLDRIEPELNEALPGDSRDTTTPDAMVQTLRKILLGDVMSKESSHILTNWMQENKISGKLLRSVLPNGWEIADRTGSGEHGSRGFTAMIWNENRKPIVLAIYLTETTLTLSERNKVIVQIGELLIKQFLF